MERKLKEMKNPNAEKHKIKYTVLDACKNINDIKDWLKANV